MWKGFSAAHRNLLKYCQVISYFILPKGEECTHLYMDILLMRDRLSIASRVKNTSLRGSFYSRESLKQL